MKKKMLAPTILAVAAIGLLGFSAVGSTRAALSTQSDFFKAEVNVSDIGVTLNENGTAVSNRDYDSKKADWNDKQDGELLTGLLGEGEKLAFGHAYTEELTVTNSGSIDTYVRVIVDRSWVDPKGEKSTALAPTMIDMDWNTTDWILVESGDPLDERVVMYYKYPLAPGETTKSPLCNTMTLDHSIPSYAHVVKVDDFTVETVYDYDGFSATLDAEADAVQAHNDAAYIANDAAAITSAWGVTPSFSGTTLVGIN